jgi:phosphate transport system permease protein
MKSWPAYLSLILGIIPVLLLAAVIIVMFWNSWHTISRLGLEELFSADFSYITTDARYQFGLLPAITGTIVVSGVSLIIALPVSLAIAVYASEYSSGGVGRALRGILGTLSGIPPIVYGLMAFMFYILFLQPAFVGYEKNAVLGGIMVSLLIIPFMAPLIDEAIRNVPANLKEASIALGATRWYTVTKTILPNAMHGIIAATALGCLKGMGDLMVVAYATGLNPNFPSPPWAIFTNTLAPLTKTAGLLSGAILPAYGCNGFACSTAYFSGILLLVMALIVLGIATLLQRWFKKRYAA